VDHVAGLALVAVIVFGVNLIPAFGPPTWAVLVYVELNHDLPTVGLVLVGAAAAASGRLVLALAFRRLRDHVSPRRRANLEAAREVLAGSRARSVAGLGLFALSPLPSAQLFEAAGLIGVALLPLTAAFFVGRLVSYSLYVGAAHTAADTSIGQVVLESVRSPVGIAIQVALLAGLVLLTRIDWLALQRRHRTPRA
jgi:membrane protein YqaA with SNARE-associated domain